MSSIARGQAVSTSILARFLSANAFEIGYRILDISAGLPGIQVFPATVDTFQDATNAPARFAVGSYYAYDPATSSGWVVPANEALGLHRIEWRWKDTVSQSAYNVASENFTVIAGGLPSTEPLYISVQQVQNAGLQGPSFVEDDIIATIRTWQQFIVRTCRQWFHPMALEMRVDGTDSDALHFGVPIISVDEIRINNSSEALNPSYYHVYNGNTYPDDRTNPRIKLVDNQFAEVDIFTAPMRDGRLLFRKGRQNQYIKGTFGNVEPDGSVPALIQRALLKLVIEKMARPLYVAPGTIAPVPPPLLAGIVIEEWTDGHKLRYAQAGGPIKPRAPGLVGITEDQEILGILRLYKAPIGLATPANSSYR